MRPHTLLRCICFITIFIPTRVDVFYIYAINEYDPSNTDPGGRILIDFSFFNDPPDFNDVAQSILIIQTDDVSSFDGIRCEGCSTGAGGIDVDITELDWHVDDQHCSQFAHIMSFLAAKLIFWC